MHATTILCVRKGDKVVMMGDGQVSQGATVVKPNAKKVRRLGEDIIAGFAGSTADCFTLMERLERKLEEHPGQLTRACVDLAKAWRTDKYLRRLEASLLVADKNVSFEITGLGDVLEPKDGVIAIGSGGTFALGKHGRIFVYGSLKILDTQKNVSGAKEKRDNHSCEPELTPTYVRRVDVHG